MSSSNPYSGNFMDCEDSDPQANRITNYFVLWPTNAHLFHKLSHYYKFLHYRVILRELVINTLSIYTFISKAAVGNTIYIAIHFNVNSITNSCIWNNCLNWQYSLQAPWGWNDSVETCRSVKIWEIIVHLLVRVQNNKRCTVQRIKMNNITNV
jgi:hypothetical protein